MASLHTVLGNKRRNLVQFHGANCSTQAVAICGVALGFEDVLPLKKGVSSYLSPTQRNQKTETNRFRAPQQQHFHQNIGSNNTCPLLSCPLHDLALFEFWSCGGGAHVDVVGSRTTSRSSAAVALWTVRTNCVTRTKPATGQDSHRSCSSKRLHPRGWARCPGRRVGRRHGEAGRERERYTESIYLIERAANRYPFFGAWEYFFAFGVYRAQLDRGAMAQLNGPRPRTSKKEVKGWRGPVRS